MKYICLKANCKKVFSHPLKLILEETPQPFTNLQQPLEGTGSPTIYPQVQVKTTIESYVCPFCQSKDFTEYVESQPEISSVKSIELAQVDDYLAQGYIVRELYAKTATLVKMEAKA